MVDVAAAPVLVTTVLWLLLILLLGYHAFTRTVGSLRTVALLLMASALFIGARLVLHSLQLLLDLGFLAQFGEHVAVVLGLALMAFASVKVRQVARGGR